MLPENPPGKRVERSLPPMSRGLAIVDEQQLARDMKLRRAIDDEERLEALRQYKILDTAPDPDYDRIASILRSSCDVAWTTITLVDSDRQWFKSHPGSDRSETSREISFCSVAMHLDQPLVVDDAQHDRRFAHNAQVTGESHLRFYAGAPIVSSEGFALGAVCLNDTRPRTLFPAQLELLCLARDWVQASLELRRLDQLILQAPTMDPAELRKVERWRAFAKYRLANALALFLQYHAEHDFTKMVPARSSSD